MKNLNYNKTYSIQIIGYKKTIITHYNNQDALQIILENNKITINSQCRYGYCGSCRIQLIYGSVVYLHTMPIAYAHPKEIFPCCCYITSDVTLLV
ncbi:MAG: class I ribonucleotide reductase maintenance protein YfaE [Buchnera aphidicola (Eriosoma harunire)]